MALDKEAFRAGVQVSHGTNAYRSYVLREARPVLAYVWENHVPWIVRKIVDFIGALDDYLDEYEGTPTGDR